MCTLCLTLLILSACTPPEQGGLLGDRLAPCSAQRSTFAELPFKDWASTYHTTVDRVIEEHLKGLQKISALRLVCTAPTTASLLPPTQDLTTLAASLPPWRSPGRQASLSEMDAAGVLLEFLRIYECANLERMRKLDIVVNDREGGILTDAPTSGPWNRGAFEFEKEAQRTRITEELATARPSLERTLDVTGGLDHLRGLSAETECLRRISLDLRNRLGLIADISACLAKVPGKTSLYDLPAP